MIGTSAPGRMWGPLLLVVTLSACEGEIGETGRVDPPRAPVPPTVATNPKNPVQPPPPSTDPTQPPPVGPQTVPQDPGTATTAPAPTRYVCDTKTWGSVAGVRRITTAEYSNAIRDVFGIDGSLKYPSAYGTASTGYSTEPAINVVGEQGVEELLYAAEDVAVALAPKVATLVSCASTGTVACAGTFLDTYARRLFRRSLTTAERTKLLAIFSAERADTASFADAVGVMTAAALQMPAFLYVIEAPSPSGVDRLLTGPELAARLALQLWSSVPDDALLAKGESGGLNTQAAILAEAQRMFADPRTDRSFSRFVREWTQTTRLEVADKDPVKFPYLDQPFADSVNGSFDRFAAGQLRAGATLRGMLRTNQTWVDANLAGFLGLPAVNGWTQVALDATKASGVMTQPALLAALAHSSETSYVFRGRTIRKRLLCENLGTPPATAQAEAAALTLPSNPTAADMSAAVIARPACGGCHNLIDAGGLALEHYDAMGAWRMAYPSNKPIVTSGTLLGTGIDFTNAGDLFEQLAALPQASDCVARQIFRFTAARAETQADNCALQQVGDALAHSGNRLDLAFLEATQTDSFRYRRGE